MTACKGHVENCEILTQFNVEPEENWILYRGGKGEVVHGKAKPKMFGKYETWITNDKQIRDPHACLAKDQVCKVSIFRLPNSWQGSTLTLKYPGRGGVDSIHRVWIRLVFLQFSSKLLNFF